MGVLGMGDIGSSVAAAAAALGMRVWGLRRSGQPIKGEALQVCTTMCV